jgi:hypothetical protein
MRCLYCGKELALLKRLTKGGDFCSDAHKQSYQEEYNRLALGRLLQAQKKGQQTSSSPPQNAAPAKTSVDLEQRGHGADGTAPAQPDLHTRGQTEALGEAASAETAGPMAVESSEKVVANSETAVQHPEPRETAGFLPVSPSLAALADGTPYQQPWRELSSGPAIWEARFQNADVSLSPADLLSLDLHPNAAPLQAPTSAAQTWAMELAPSAAAGPHSAIVMAPKIANAHGLPRGAGMAMDIAPHPLDLAADVSLVHAVAFNGMAVFEDSQFLELPPTSIDFLAEDSEVMDLAYPPGGAVGGNEGTALTETVTESEISGEYKSPRAALQALSRLHRELAVQESPAEESLIAGSVIARSVFDDARLDGEPPQTIEARRVEIVQAVAVARPERVLDEPLGAPPEVVEIAAQQVHPAAQPSQPGYATELLEISSKTFPPAKPAVIEGDAFPSHAAPLLPRLKSLPLRPKVALATGYIPPADSPESAERARGPLKPASSGKPAAGQPTIAQPAQVPERVAQQPGMAGGTPKNQPAAKGPALKPEPEADGKKPIGEMAKPQAHAASKPNETNPGAAPTFDIAQPSETSWLSSLKLKLGLAIALLVIACVYFLGWGRGVSSGSANSSAAASSDGSGPSIILGEGGWVEGWAGDPAGMHGGRQITIYRPSLKLSDYRLEFQGSVDTKSLGWVFRASDPDNYYAMKLMTVASGLTTKVALFKYLVAGGKQTQVGRVPIDMGVQPDTVFDVRMDIRGPQFTTYIQGQQVDSWTDDQLKIGGAGFLNEREERGKVKSVSIRYLSGVAK